MLYDVDVDVEKKREEKEKRKKDERLSSHGMTTVCHLEEGASGCSCTLRFVSAW